MPRPNGGYLNAAGQQVPGTNDITGRFQNPHGLYWWYYNNGKSGLPFKPDAAINIGSAVHKMCELDLMGAPDREIEAALNSYLSARNHLEMAHNAFGAFREWRQQVRMKVLKQEVSAVSEKHQYGGTPDLIAIIDGGIGILDFKTSTKGEVYDNMKIALAAHANLWNETCADPRLKIDTYHLIILPKNGGKPKPYSYDDLSREWEMFLLQRRLYDLEKAPAGQENSQRTVSTAAADNANVKANKTRAPSASAAPSARERATSQRVKSSIGSAPLTMAEILRSYGHVKEIAA